MRKRVLAVFMAIAMVCINCTVTHADELEEYEIAGETVDESEVGEITVETTDDVDAGDDIAAEEDNGDDADVEADEDGEAESDIETDLEIEIDADTDEYVDIEAESDVDSDTDLQAAADNLTKVDIVEGSNIDTFEIARPNPAALESNKVNASQFGLSVSNEDNFDAFQSALDYCKSHPNTYLEIDKGVYSFKKNATLQLTGFNNVLIEGNGAEFIFENQKQFSVSKCNGVEFHNLVIDWNWEEKRIASLVRVQNKTPNSFEIVFLELDDVDENIKIASFQQYDSREYSAGSYGAYRCFVPDEVPGSVVSVEKVDRNVLKVNISSKFTTVFHNEDVYILRHYIYGGQVFSVNGSSKNITFDNVRIYGNAGMGYVFGDKASHFQIINSYIGLRPGNENKQRMSTTVDAIHVLNTDGYFRIDNCDFSFTGDDIINVHDDMMKVLTVNSTTELYGYLTGGFAKAGDKIRFYNPQLYEVDFETEVESIERHGYTATIKLKDEIPKEVSVGYLIYRSSGSTHNYVISNNYIHECRGRAALLNGPDALFENNRVYRTSPGCIEVTVGISEKENKTWYEGIGSNNVVINNNVFEECCFGSGSEVIYVGYDKGDNTSVISNVRITNNEFYACFGETITSDTVSDLVFENNYISGCGTESMDQDMQEKNTIVRPSDTCPHTDTMQVGARGRSCYEFGSTGRTYCKQCRTIIVKEEIGINPYKHNDEHKYWVKRIDVAPTCTESGLSSVVCSLCGYVDKTGVEESATGHHFVAVLSDAAGTVSTSHKCRDCGTTAAHDKSGVNGTCSVCGYGKSISVSSMSLELNTGKMDYIGINLYIDAPAGTVFYVDGTSIDPILIASTGLYKIQYKCAPKELADKHILTVADSRGVSQKIDNKTEYTYSGDMYCRYIVSAGSDYSDELKSVCNSLLEYSEQARNYFGYNTSGLVAGSVSADLPTKDFEMQTTGILPNGSTYLGSSLILGDEVVLRHYFAGDSKRYVYNCTDTTKNKVTTYSVGQVDSAAVFYVDIPVNYSNIGDMFTLRIRAYGGYEYNIKYGVVTYCNNVQALSTDSKLTGLCNSLYNLSVAIANYKTSV